MSALCRFCVYDLWLGRSVTAGGWWRQMKLMPYNNARMCGGEPCYFHRSGLSFM